MPEERAGAVNRWIRKISKIKQIMMMNGASSLSRKQAMSPVNGQQMQSGSNSGSGGGGGVSMDSPNNTAGDANMHRHPHHHPMGHHSGGQQSSGGGGAASAVNGTNNALGGHLDSPGGGAGGTGSEAGERRHTILPPCPLEKPPRGKREKKRERNVTYQLEYYWG